MAQRKCKILVEKVPQKFTHPEIFMGNNDLLVTSRWNIHFASFIHKQILFVYIPIVGPSTMD